MSEQQNGRHPPKGWGCACEAGDREAFEAAKTLPLESLAKQRRALDVALKVCAFIERAGIDADAPTTLEGLLLAMQMIGGPNGAADVVRYCSFRRD